MLYLTAHKVLSPTGQTGVNAFRYAQAAVRSFELVEVDDPGVLEAQRIEVSPGGNEVLCFLDVLAPDATEPRSIKLVLEALRQSWEAGRLEAAVQDDVHAHFVPGSTPAKSIPNDLECVIRGLVAVAESSPAPSARDARPVTITVTSTDDGQRYALDEDSRLRLKLVQGAVLGARSVSVPHQTAGNYAASCPRLRGRLNI